jgi:lysophospholipase L1-like esterase
MRRSFSALTVKQTLKLALILTLALVLSITAHLSWDPYLIAQPPPPGNPASPSTSQQPAATITLKRTTAKLASGQELRIVIWGDSISEVGRVARWHGGASKDENNWGAVLAAKLREKYPSTTITLIHAGIGGQNSYEGLGRLDALWPMNPDLVFVQFGANDSGHHRLIPEETRQALTEMCKRVSEKADVILVGTAGNHPDDKTFHHVDETVAASRQAAVDAKVLFVDMQAVMLNVTQNYQRWKEFHLNAANCHPNDAGHAVWAEAAMKALLGAIKAE